MGTTLRAYCIFNYLTKVNNVNTDTNSLTINAKHGHDLVSYQCQHGHKLVNYLRHLSFKILYKISIPNLVLYFKRVIQDVSRSLTKKKLLSHFNQSGVYSNWRVLRYLCYRLAQIYISIVNLFTDVVKSLSQYRFWCNYVHS